MRAEMTDADQWQPVSIATVAARVAALASGTAPPVILAVDGRSGSGKTTVAAELAARLDAAPVIHTDDVAWHHSFFDWWPMMRDELLLPLRSGRPVAWRPPGWVARGRSGSIDVPAASVVLVEGVGASRRALVDLLDATIWVAGDRVVQERRGVLRDGGDAAAQRFWDEWQAEERPFMSADRPWERADIRVQGTPTAPAPDGCWWASWGPSGRLGDGSATAP